MKNYVGRKIRGFRFEDGTDGVRWNEQKKFYINKKGSIIRQGSDFVDVAFQDDWFPYPISLIEPHLIEEENNANQTSLVKCGDCNKHYRCTTCGAICGTEGHYVEKEPYLIEECTCDKIGDNICNYCEELQDKAILEDAKSKMQSPEIIDLSNIKGVEMMVRDQKDATPTRVTIIATVNNRFIDWFGNHWYYAEPIPQLPKYTHAELVEKLGHEFEYIK
jgi:hypothetical protein